MKATKTSEQQQCWMADHPNEGQEDDLRVFRAELSALRRGTDHLVMASIGVSLILLATALALMIFTARSSDPWLAIPIALPLVIGACFTFPPLLHSGYVRLGVLYLLSLLVLVGAGAGVFAGASLGMGQMLITVLIGLGVVAIATGTATWCIRTASAEKGSVGPVAVFLSGSVLSLAVSILWAYQSM